MDSYLSQTGIEPGSPIPFPYDNNHYTTSTSLGIYTMDTSEITTDALDLSFMWHVLE